MLYFSPVPLFLTSTLAPGMTAPDVSVTVPDSDVKKLPCANARAVKENTRDAARSTQANRTLIETLPTDKYRRTKEIRWTVNRPQLQRQREKAQNKEVIAEPIQETGWGDSRRLRGRTAKLRS